MKGLILLGLFGVGALAIWKHHKGALATHTAADANGIPSGVSVYSSIPAANSPQQILAAFQTNSSAVSDLGFAPAFGESENQPGPGEVLY